jgi:excinuclease ABC subunit C
VTGDHATSVKTRALMQAVAALETIVVPSEAHALILEANLIKEYKPKYNIALRDDKSYPYIKVTVAEAFPRVWVTRHLVDDGSRYFGPYTDVGAMRRALNVVKRLFTVRSCNFDMPKQMPERPCLDYYIKRCKAPCILAQSQGEYQAMIDEVLVFLDGRAEEVVRRVRERMPPSRWTSSAPRSCAMRSTISSKWKNRPWCSMSKAAIATCSDTRETATTRWWR